MEIVVLTIGFLGIVSVFFTKQGFLGGGVAVLAFLTYFFKNRRCRSRLPGGSDSGGRHGIGGRKRS